MNIKQLIALNNELNEESKRLAIEYNKIGTDSKICLACHKLMFNDKFYRGHWRCKHCDKIAARCKHNITRYRCKECNPIGHLCASSRSTINGALKRNSKRGKAIDLLGCTIQEYKEHIEKQFTEGMSWDNYGKWHIDHTIPLQYDNPSVEDVLARLHYTNTQPLWAIDNIRKGNKLN